MLLVARRFVHLDGACHFALRLGLMPIQLKNRDAHKQMAILVRVRPPNSNVPNGHGLDMVLISLAMAIYISIFAHLCYY